MSITRSYSSSVHVLHRPGMGPDAGVVDEDVERAEPLSPARRAPPPTRRCGRRARSLPLAPADAAALFCACSASMSAMTTRCARPGSGTAAMPSPMPLGAAGHHGDLSVQVSHAPHPPGVRVALIAVPSAPAINASARRPPSDVLSAAERGRCRARAKPRAPPHRPAAPGSSAARRLEMPQQRGLHREHRVVVEVVAGSASKMWVVSALVAGGAHDDVDVGRAPGMAPGRGQHPPHRAVVGIG